MKREIMFCKSPYGSSFNLLTSHNEYLDLTWIRLVTRLNDSKFEVLSNEEA